MLAEELEIIDADSSLWAAARPFLDAALRLEQNDEEYTWHGWTKRQIASFLATLPQSCSLVVGVWQIQVDETAEEQEVVALGIVCAVVGGEICSIRTFDALAEEREEAKRHWEPGFEDALEIMRAARSRVAPVAWALFTDTTTWHDWVLTDDEAAHKLNKGELLATFARQGRCVLMGNQTTHHH